MNSYTDFRFEINSLLIYKQEKRYCFFILYLERHSAVENYKILLVLISRCFLLFLVQDSLTSSHINSNNQFNTHNISTDIIYLFNNQYQYFFYIISESELLIFFKFILSL